MKLKHVKGTEPGATALFSECERYRYQLERLIDPDPMAPLYAAHGIRRLVACGLNPSTADAFKLDPTCRRVRAFASAWGCGLYVMINAYAWRATLPADMFLAEENGHSILGERLGNAALQMENTNDAVIRAALTMLKRDGGVALACWGKHAAPERVLKLSRIAHEVGVEWMCLGTNKGGSPKHPLYVKAVTQPQPWAA